MENLEYIFECLEEKDITVIGKDSSIDMVKNYEYINTYKPCFHNFLYKLLYI